MVPSNPSPVGTSCILAVVSSGFAWAIRVLLAMLQYRRSLASGLVPTSRSWVVRTMRNWVEMPQND
jgi:hypothetical protein